MHFLVESRFKVDLVVHYISGKPNSFILPSGNGIFQLYIEELHYTGLGSHLVILK